MWVVFVVKKKTVVACSQLVAFFGLSVACRVCGVAAESILRDFLLAGRIPAYAGSCVSRSGAQVRLTGPGGRQVAP